MENYLKNYNSLDKVFIYDFKFGYGGIGDYLKFFMITLIDCINHNIKFRCKMNYLEIQKYIKIKSKYDFFKITIDEIYKLNNNFKIKFPIDYYLVNEDLINISLSEIFYFDDIIKKNVKNILPVLPKNHISIHLRMGDKFLETDKKFIFCKEDKRKFSEYDIFQFIENNIDKNLIFFCDNNKYKLKIKNKYKNIIITNANIGHTSLENTTSNQVIDTVTEFYILSISQSICRASRSGFSKMAIKFYGAEKLPILTAEDKLKKEKIKEVVKILIDDVVTLVRERTKRLNLKKVEHEKNKMDVTG